MIKATLFHKNYSQKTPAAGLDNFNIYETIGTKKKNGEACTMLEQGGFKSRGLVCMDIILTIHNDAEICISDSF